MALSSCHARHGGLLVALPPPGEYVDANGNELRNNCLVQSMCLDLPATGPELLPTMRDAWLRPLMQRFSQMLLEQPLFADVFGAV